MPEKAESPTKTLNTIERSLLEGEVIEAIRTVYDPELPVNVYDLGLIYNIEVSEVAHVHVTMTLTSPNCPVAGILPGEIEMAAGSVSGVNSTSLDLVWDPPFTIDRIPEHIRLELGLF
jgi:FeS assembly SUF system protein